MDLKVSPFLEALDCMDNDYALAKSYLEDDGLSLLEKKIIQSWFLLRNSKFDEALEKISSPNDPTPFHLFQIHLLKGLIHNNKGDAKTALPYFKEAELILTKLKTKRKQFVLFYNMFVCCQNLKDIKGMKYAMGRLEDLECKRDNETIAILKCSFNYAAFIMDLKGADAILKKLKTYEKKMNESMKISYLIDVFDYHLKADRPKKSKETLASMKAHRKFFYSANYKYMSRLLGFLMEGTPLYLYERDFKDHPDLQLQVKVLLAPEIGEKDKFKKLWLDLSGQDPDCYRPDFTYAGDKCLFSLCLNKLQEKQTSDIPPYDPEENKEDYLIRLFSNPSLESISKDDLHDLFWGKAEYREFNKLERLISRMRTKHGFDLQYRKGHYTLKGKKAS